MSNKTNQIITIAILLIVLYNLISNLLGDNALKKAKKELDKARDSINLVINRNNSLIEESKGYKKTLDEVKLKNNEFGLMLDSVRIERQIANAKNFVELQKLKTNYKKTQNALVVNRAYRDSIYKD